MKFRSVCEKSPTPTEQILNYNIELCSIVQVAALPVQLVSMAKRCLTHFSKVENVAKSSESKTIFALLSIRTPCCGNSFQVRETPLSTQ